MLTYLAVKDFALVNALELEFAGGMTVITGETGAGKSILIEALGLVLGDRADSGMIRNGAEQASVQAIFIPPASGSFRAWLAAQGIDWGEELIIKRQFSRDGRSRAFINGSPVTVQMLRETGEQLADIHGQHEHHRLLKREVQRDLLDGYGNHAALLTAVRENVAQVRAAAAELENLRTLRGRDARSVEILRHEVTELSALKLSAESVSQLVSQHQRASHAADLIEGVQTALAGLSDAPESAEALLAQTTQRLRALCRLDTNLQTAASLLENAHISVQEAAQTLHQYLDRLELNPREAQTLETRMTQLHDLARKHRVEIEDLPAKAEALDQELAMIDDSGARLQQLQAAHQAALKAYASQAQELTRARQKTAANLAREIEKYLPQLGMPSGHLQFVVSSDDPLAVSDQGADQVECQVSLNPGQPLKPLARVASGGELSRISLAIQVVSARQKIVPILVFDEVDVGIGGAVAEVVGQCLRQLGERGQVLCVTHLPQVAALGHQHLQISKQVEKGQTLVSAHTLTGKQRVEELARMLGGVNLSAQTREHAKALLALASGSATLQ